MKPGLHSLGETAENGEELGDFQISLKVSITVYILKSDVVGSVERLLHVHEDRGDHRHRGVDDEGEAVLGDQVGGLVNCELDRGRFYREEPVHRRAWHAVWPQPKAYK